jgi:hypothetical protein
MSLPACHRRKHRSVRRGVRGPDRSEPAGHRRGQRDARRACLGLEALALTEVDLLGDHDVRVVAEMDVPPCQAEQLADAHAGLREHRVERTPLLRASR